jgi:D-alanine-D-alanine ligase
MTLEVAVLLGDPRLGISPRKRFSSADLIAVERMHTALSSLEGYHFRYINEHRDLAKELRLSPPDLVLNLCDHGFRNDATMEAHIPALLDLLGIPYSGATPACLSKCSDSALVCSIAQTLGIPAPRQVWLPAKTAPIGRDIPIPAAIEPLCSCGTGHTADQCVARSLDEACNMIARLRNAMPGHTVVIREFLSGPEYSVGIVGNLPSGLDVLPVLEVDRPRIGHTGSVIPYPSRRSNAGARAITYRKADLSTALRQRLSEYATSLFERLGCRDYACINFGADDSGHIKLLSVRPNPSWRWHGELAAMHGLRDRHYPDVFRMILTVALTRTGHSTGPQLRSLAAAD